MKSLTNKELLNVEGGASSIFTSAFFTSAARAIENLMELGRSLGSAIRRAFSGKVCPV